MAECLITLGKGSMTDELKLGAFSGHREHDVHRKKGKRTVGKEAIRYHEARLIRLQKN